MYTQTIKISQIIPYLDENSKSIYDIYNRFVINTYERKKILIISPITKKIEEATHYKIVRTGKNRSNCNSINYVLFYIFDNNQPFFLFRCYNKNTSHQNIKQDNSTPLSAIYYYKINKLFIINELSVPEDIMNFCINYEKLILNKKVKINNNNFLIIINVFLHQNDNYVNIAHNIIDNLPDFLSYFDKYDSDNTTFLISDNFFKGDAFDIKQYLECNKFNIIKTHEESISALPLLFDGVSRRKNIKNRRDNLHKITSYILKTNYNFNYSWIQKNKFKILVCIKLNRRITINMKDFLCDFIIRSFTQFKNIQIFINFLFSPKKLGYDENGDIDKVHLKKINENLYNELNNCKNFYNELISCISDLTKDNIEIKELILNNIKNMAIKNIYYLIGLLNNIDMYVGNCGDGIVSIAVEGSFNKPIILIENNNMLKGGGKNYKYNINPLIHTNGSRPNLKIRIPNSEIYDILNIKLNKYDFYIPDKNIFCVKTNTFNNHKKSCHCNNEITDIKNTIEDLIKLISYFNK